MKFNGINPLVPELRIFSPQIPNVIIYANVKAAFVKFVRLWAETKE